MAYRQFRLEGHRAIPTAPNIDIDTLVAAVQRDAPTVASRRRVLAMQRLVVALGRGGRDQAASALSITVGAVDQALGRARGFQEQEVKETLACLEDAEGVITRQITMEDDPVDPASHPPLILCLTRAVERHAASTAAYTFGLCPEADWLAAGPGIAEPAALRSLDTTQSEDRLYKLAYQDLTDALGHGTRDRDEADGQVGRYGLAVIRTVAHRAEQRFGRGPVISWLSRRARGEQ